MADQTHTSQPVYQSLTEKQRRFVDQYLIEANATKAAQIAGYGSPHNQGPRLLQNARIRDALAERDAERQRRVEIDQDAVLTKWWEIVTADANDLSQHRHGACRYCYGEDHEYQRKTEREFRHAFEKAVKQIAGTDANLAAELRDGAIRAPSLPDDSGGYGYRITRDPAPDCPEAYALAKPPKATRQLGPRTSADVTHL